MRILRHNAHRIIAVVGGLCLVAGAVGMAQRRPATTFPPAHDARDLSTIFRTVARETLPSVVSVESKVEFTSRQRDSQGEPFGDGSPFNDFFGRDPRFREFFRRLPEGNLPPRIGMGSGFIIDGSGVILTNSHVVSGATEVTVKLHDGREFTATDIKTDPRSDVAIVRIDAPSDLRPIRMGDSDAMEIGDWVLAVGSPFRMDFSVTHGIISAKGRGPQIADRENFLQTDAAINPGNSGGPLLNLNGEVIGISTAISTRSGGSQGIGFAIPTNMAKWVSQQLVKTGKVERAYIGVGVQTIDSDQSKTFKTPVGQGALVRRVFADSPAAEVGIEPGDIILELDGQAIGGSTQLQSLAEKLTIDKKYQMTVQRDGKRMEMPITLRALPDDYTAADLSDPRGKRPSASDAYAELGIEVEALTPRVAKQLGLPDASGVLVSSTDAAGPAARAGLTVGDVIEKVGTQKVSSPSDFRKAMKNASLEDGVLFFVRDRQGTRFIEIKIRR